MALTPKSMPPLVMNTQNLGPQQQMLFLVCFIILLLNY